MLRVLIYAALVLMPSVGLAGERVIILAIENMTCATCPITVRTAIGRVVGVKDVKVDFSQRTATVVFDDGVATPERLTEASRLAGFPATLKE